MPCNTQNFYGCHCLEKLFGFSFPGFLTFCRQLHNKCTWICLPSVRNPSRSKVNLFPNIILERGSFLFCGITHFVCFGSSNLLRLNFYHIKTSTEHVELPVSPFVFQLCQFIININIPREHYHCVIPFFLASFQD